MRNLNRIFLAILTVFTMSTLGCSFGGSKSTNENKAEQEDRDRFMQEYAAVFGVYEGPLSTRPPQNIQLSIYHVDVPDGETSTGQPRLKTVAKARFRYLNSGFADVFMDVRYLAETSELQMTKEVTPSLPGAPAPVPGDTFIVRANLNGEFITGNVVKRGGTLGNLNLRLVSRESSAPGQGEWEEHRERLKRLYQPMVGLYRGKVTYPNGNPSVIGFDMTISIAEQPIEGGLSVPVLISYYQRHDDPQRAITLTFDCDYNPDADPPRINMTSRPFPGPPNTYKLTVSAQVKDGVISGTMLNQHTAETGQMSIKRIRRN